MAKKRTNKPDATIALVKRMIAKAKTDLRNEVAQQFEDLRAELGKDSPVTTLPTQPEIAKEPEA